MSRREPCLFDVLMSQSGHIKGINNTVRDMARRLFETRGRFIRDLEQQNIIACACWLYASRHAYSSEQLRAMDLLFLCGFFKNQQWAKTKIKYELSRIVLDLCDAHTAEFTGMSTVDADF